MKTVAFTPSRLNSQRVPQKNIKNLGGIPLVNYSLQTISAITSIDDVVLFASEPSICRFIRSELRYKFLQRPQSLDTQEATVQDLIREFLKLNAADIIVMFHITSPFLRESTIAECVDKVKGGAYQSAFTAFEVNENCWFAGKPLNHSIADDAGQKQRREPVVVEHSLYVFKREVFEKTGQRISSRPFIKIIDSYEGHDIDTPEDFRVAELIQNSGLARTL